MAAHMPRARRSPGGTGCAGSGASCDTGFSVAGRLCRPKWCLMRRVWRRLLCAVRLLVAVFVVTLPLSTPLIRGDRLGYYAYARSMLINGDLRFEKDWLVANASFVRGVTDATGRIRPDQYTPTGYVANHFTVGPSLLWFPPLALTHLFVLAGQKLGATLPADG